jgi:hypothetical protein
MKTTIFGSAMVLLVQLIDRLSPYLALVIAILTIIHLSIQIRNGIRGRKK